MKFYHYSVGTISDSKQNTLLSVSKLNNLFTTAKTTYDK